MVVVNWTDQAVFDLITIAEFIAKDSEKFAIITANKIRGVAKKISQFPKLGRMVPEFAIEEIREIIVGNYRVIYEIISHDRVDILTVHHSSRRLDFGEFSEFGI